MSPWPDGLRRAAEAAQRLGFDYEGDEGMRELTIRLSPARSLRVSDPSRSAGTLLVEALLPDGSVDTVMTMTPQTLLTRLVYAKGQARRR